MHYLGSTRTALFINDSHALADVQLDAVLAAVAKRHTGMPLAYVLGVAHFYGRTIKVTPDVLIPRPETEELVSYVISQEKKDPALFLDLCTGSGAIAATVCEERPQWQGIGLDISEEALAVAKKNCNQNVMLVQADFLAACAPRCSFDFIVCNPPYITKKEYADLDRQVRDFEPQQALVGGDDGLFFYRLLAQQACTLLKPGGRVYCEIGANQKKSVEALFDIKEFTTIKTTRDMSGHERIFYAKAFL